MVRVGEGIAVTASARPSARTSRVQVRFGLHLRLSWEASRIITIEQLMLVSSIRHPTSGKCE